MPEVLHPCLLGKGEQCQLNTSNLGMEKIYLALLIAVAWLVPVYGTELRLDPLKEDIWLSVVHLTVRNTDQVFVAWRCHRAPNHYKNCEIITDFKEIVELAKSQKSGRLLVFSKTLAVPKPSTGGHEESLFLDTKWREMEKRAMRELEAACSSVGVSAYVNRSRSFPSEWVRLTEILKLPTINK